MLRDSESFPSYSVDDVEAAKAFYGDKLGLDIKDGPMGVLDLSIGGGTHLMMYPKGPGHQPATFTVLNFMVDDIEAAVDKLVAAGIAMEQYDTEYTKTNEKGIARDDSGGPAIAWFKDPAGNIIAVMQQR
jgi:predicted enzyme related to lactoylglutathione lyase